MLFVCLRFALVSTTSAQQTQQACQDDPLLPGCTLPPPPGEGQSAWQIGQGMSLRVVDGLMRDSLRRRR
jgi:hypothetical protein